MVSLCGVQTSFNIPAGGHVLTGYNDGNLHEQGREGEEPPGALLDYWSRHVGMTSELDYQVMIPRPRFVTSRRYESTVCPDTSPDWPSTNQ